MYHRDGEQQEDFEGKDEEELRKTHSSMFKTCERTKKSSQARIMIELLVQGKEGSEEGNGCSWDFLRQKTDSPMISWTAGSE